MNDAKFYHVYLRQGDNVTEEMIQSKMDLSLDWFQYDKCNWVLYTNVPIDALVLRLLPLAEQKGRLFVCELNTHSTYGWMDKIFWDWLNTSRQNQTSVSN